MLTGLLRDGDEVLHVVVRHLQIVLTVRIGGLSQKHPFFPIVQEFLEFLELALEKHQTGHGWHEPTYTALTLPTRLTDLIAQGHKTFSTLRTKGITDL